MVFRNPQSSELSADISKSTRFLFVSYGAPTVKYDIDGDGAVTTFGAAGERVFGVCYENARVNIGNGSYILRDGYAEIFTVAVRICTLYAINAVDKIIFFGAVG